MFSRMGKEIKCLVIKFAIKGIFIVFPNRYNFITEWITCLWVNEGDQSMHFEFVIRKKEKKVCILKRLKKDWKKSVKIKISLIQRIIYS